MEIVLLISYSDKKSISRRNFHWIQQMAQNFLFWRLWLQRSFKTSRNPLGQLNEIKKFIYFHMLQTMEFLYHHRFIVRYQILGGQTLKMRPKYWVGTTIILLIIAIDIGWARVSVPSLFLRACIIMLVLTFKFADKLKGKIIKCQFKWSFRRNKYFI